MDLDAPLDQVGDPVFGDTHGAVDPTLDLANAVERALGHLDNQVGVRRVTLSVIDGLHHRQVRLGLRAVASGDRGLDPDEPPRIERPKEVRVRRSTVPGPRPRAPTDLQWYSVNWVWEPVGLPSGQVCCLQGTSRVPFRILPVLWIPLSGASRPPPDL